MRTLACVVLALSACTPSAPKIGDAPADGGTTQGPDDAGNCIDPSSCNTTGNPDFASSCGQQTVALASTQVMPNVMFVIDRSGSMAQPPDNSSNVSKWDGLVSSLGAVLDQNAGKARWGLSLFPSGTDQQSCASGTIDVPVAANDEASIKSAVSAFSSDEVAHLNGATPTAGAIEAITSANVLVDPSRANYVVLMTDGQPNCGKANDVTPAIEALYAAAPSVRTFVIGFGADANGSAATYLNAWAVAGHTDQMGATKYYAASSVSDLQTAFQAIVTGVASCSYALASPPADPSLIAPYLDGQPVASNATNGFTYDASTQSVVFHGTTCAQIQSGAVSKVSFIYGCPVGPIE